MRRWQDVTCLHIVPGHWWSTDHTVDTGQWKAGLGFVCGSSCWPVLLSTLIMQCLHLDTTIMLHVYWKVLAWISSLTDHRCQFPKLAYLSPANNFVHSSHYLFISEKNIAMYIETFMLWFNIWGQNKLGCLHFLNGSYSLETSWRGKTQMDVWKINSFHISPPPHYPRRDRYLSGNLIKRKLPNI